jgi:GGDEF domain-containing protein
LISGSIGISINPNHENKLEELMLQAYFAMYQAKAYRRNAYAFSCSHAA